MFLGLCLELVLDQIGLQADRADPPAGCRPPSPPGNRTTASVLRFFSLVVRTRSSLSAAEECLISARDRERRDRTHSDPETLPGFLQNWALCAVTNNTEGSPADSTCGPAAFSPSLSCRRSVLVLRPRLDREVVKLHNIVSWFQLWAEH